MEHIIKRLSKKSRKRNVVWERYFMFNYLKERGYTLQQIADKFNMISHKSVYCGLKNHKTWIEENDPEYYKVITKLQVELDECKNIDYVHLKKGQRFIGRNSKHEDYEMDKFEMFVGGWYVGRKSCYRDVKLIEVKE